MLSDAKYSTELQPSFTYFRNLLSKGVMLITDKRPTESIPTFKAHNMDITIRNRSPDLPTLVDPRHLTSPLSPIEKFVILTEDRELVRLALSYWDPQMIMQFGQCSMRVHSAVKFYESEMWGPCDLLRRYLWKVAELLALLEMNNAVVFGPSVVQFFDRVVDHTVPLDICVGYAGAERIEQYLEGEGYYFRPHLSSGEPHRFGDAVIRALASFSRFKRIVDGERNSNQYDNDSRIFVFQQTTSGTDDSEKICLHLTRCDPLRHILSLHSGVFPILYENPFELFFVTTAGLMNVITSTHAISLFPKSTFVDRRALVSRQDTVFADYHRGGQKFWLDKYCHTYHIKKVGFSRVPFLGKECGERRFGDAASWCILCENTCECEV